jgi:hypothetical protein
MVLLVGGPLDGIELPRVAVDRDVLSVSPDAFATVETSTLKEVGSVPARKAIYRSIGDAAKVSTCSTSSGMRNRELMKTYLIAAACVIVTLPIWLLMLGLLSGELWMAYPAIWIITTLF